MYDLKTNMSRRKSVVYKKALRINDVERMSGAAL